jgi:PAS domain S-box-containing protein
MDSDLPEGGGRAGALAGAAGGAARVLSSPSTEALLEGVLQLGRGVHLELDETALVELFLQVLGRLFPERALAVRVCDPRSDAGTRVYGRGAPLRDRLDQARLCLRPSAIAKTRLKSALVESALVRCDERWDSPFAGIAAGFGVPLVASGELYGVLDVGYPLGQDRTASDEPLLLPIANQLSVALRNQRLHRETTLLRDYQATLIEHANALILGVDRSFSIRVCNQALCRLTGYARSELIGRDVRDWLPERDRAHMSRLVVEALAGEAPAGGDQGTIEIDIETRRGERVRTVWSVAAIRADGVLDAVVAIGQDQTVLHKLQRQVVQAEKLATLGQLAAGVVHELNNPLTSISVYADFLLGKYERALDSAAMVPEPGDVEKLRRIVAGAQRILRFSRDLVQYAKPAGEDTEPVLLGHVVAQSLAFCEHLFEAGGIALERQLDDQLPRVRAVPAQLEQVIINLVTNAVHAIGDAGQVAVRTFRAGDGMVALSVGDSGPGIPEGERERIFEPFFTTKSDGKGTGLGLSIVRNIVRQHGGRVIVGTSEAGGALFTVLLPACRQGA